MGELLQAERESHEPAVARGVAGQRARGCGRETAASHVRESVAGQHAREVQGTCSSRTYTIETAMRDRGTGNLHQHLTPRS